MRKDMKIATALEHLGLDKHAGEEDVKQAYRDLVKIWHPDRFQNDERLGARTEAQLKVINEAKTVALAYIEKYGHFRHVTESTGTKQARPGARRNPYQKEEEPKKEKAEPEPEEKPKKKPKPPKPPKEPRDWDFDFDLNFNIIIGTIVSFGLLGFMYFMSTSILIEPPDKVKAFQKKSAVDIIQVRGDKKRAARNKRQQEAAALAESAESQPVIIDTFFTLGSDKKWVSFVQGAPFQIKGSEWRYGFSTIQFERGKVVGWNSSELNPLKYGMPLDSIWLFPNRYFSVGSFVQEVIALQGSPNVIEGDIWKYGEALIQFDSDTVVYWENDPANRLWAR